MTGLTISPVTADSITIGSVPASRLIRRKEEAVSYTGASPLPDEKDKRMRSVVDLTASARMVRAVPW